jgi:hypothetical protein
MKTIPMTAKDAADALGISTVTLYRRAEKGEIEHDASSPRLFFVPESEILDQQIPADWIRGSVEDIADYAGAPKDEVMRWLRAGKLSAVGSNGHGTKTYAVSPKMIKVLCDSAPEPPANVVSRDMHEAYKAMVAERFKACEDEIESLRNRVRIEGAKVAPLKAELAGLRTELEKAKARNTRDGKTIMNCLTMLAKADGLMEDGDYLEDAVARTIKRLESMILESDALQDEVARMTAAVEYLEKRRAYDDADKSLAAARRAIADLAAREAM